MFGRILFFGACLLAVAYAHEFRFKNNCKHPIWMGILGNPGKGTPEGGGFKMDAGASRSIKFNKGWGGRFWARTECDGSGKCVTGDCGRKIQCNGAGGVPPVTLAEILLDGHANQDYYDISLVDGYNLPAKMWPIAGTFKKQGNSKYDCATAGCSSDLNKICPNELKMNHNGRTVACKSACLHFNTDQYCCRGKHGTPQTCKSQHWPKNYPAVFKKACPDAYSYAYDDTLSTFTCRGGNTGYHVQFC